MEADAPERSRNPGQRHAVGPGSVTQSTPGAGLTDLRAAAWRMVDDLSPLHLRQQAHVELSPILWHLGHVFFVENYWLAERVFGDRRVTDRWRGVYFPEDCLKSERSEYLPELAELKAWVAEVAAINDRYWARVPEVEHPLLADGYLHTFLRGHYAQHLETMRLARVQLGAATADVAARLTEKHPPYTANCRYPSGTANIGSDAIDGYDNEQPRHRVVVDEFAIARKPVTNAEWLGFMAAGGYRRPEFWCDDGWAWRCRDNIDKPQHWWTDAHGELGIPATHGKPVGPSPVHGINWFEASAFARYAQARLPHETEWEAARRADLLDHVGCVWEWCANAFYPYPGFRAFPYDRYSQAWFDGQHFVTRGASVLTEPDIRRPSFRNFYPATHRHVFAGLRLAWSDVAWRDG